LPRIEQKKIVAETRAENSVCHRIWSLDMHRLTNLIIILLLSDRRVKRHVIVWEVNASLLPASFQSPQSKRLTIHYLKERDSHILDLPHYSKCLQKNFLNNSDTAYVGELYSDLSVKQVKIGRAINCKASERAGLCQGTGLHGDIV
jgi:hypothetical protein